MPRRKASAERLPAEEQLRSLRKRPRGDGEAELAELDLNPPTPSKRRRSSVPETNDNDDIINSTLQDMGMNVTEDALNPVVDGDSVQPEPLQEDAPPQVTPRKRGRPPKNPNAVAGSTPTPKSRRTAPLRTPTKPLALADDSTPHRQMGADRSARRKSARALIEQVVRGDGSDDEVDEDGLAREIYESSEDEHRDDITEATEADATSVVDSAPEIAAVEGTPSKTRRKRKARSPTPPRELPPHELYFAQNKPGRPKTSGNTLASLSLLTHDEYFALLGDLSDRHAGDVEFLERLHAESFPQWSFELAQGFSICLYGYGSKRAVLQKLARHLHARPPSRGGKHRIVIVNGYTATTTMREILTTLAVAIDPAHRIPVTLPATMVPNILSHLGASDTTLTIVVNSIDALPMRKPGYQAVLAQLAAHPQVQLACSADTPDFPLLWDIGIRSAFNFAFHDCTTFAPFAVELDIVDDVHELLGRKSQRVNGREGVAFVLRSLPENAKNLFQLIIGEVLIASEEEGAGAEDSGVEYRMVYNKAVEEFICSSEMAFRTLLKEFHDHQIITSRKDALGTELLSLPFRKEELEAILEDLMA